VHDSVLAGQLRAVGLELPGEVLVGLQRYLDMIVKWNRTINLTALSGPALARRLVVEPLWVARRLQPGGTYADIGAGNGSPAIPWLLARHFSRADLVESRVRRAAFLRQVVRTLPVAEAAVHTMRFSEYSAPAHRRGSIDWVTLQGVRYTREIQQQVQRVASPHARTVWFTRDACPPLPPSEIVQLPDSDRCALIFGG
jgi:16S rRNA G527 N7-methylase RsmG